MTEETKIILDEIRSLKTDVSDMKADMAEVKTEVSALKTDMAEVKAEVSALKTDMAEVKAEVSALKTDMAEVKDDIRNINLALENDISKKIDIIGEGHDFINRKLDRALLRESHWERIELEIISLRTDTRMIKKHLNIA